jgi:hypothetical protein
MPSRIAPHPNFPTGEPGQDISQRLAGDAIRSLREIPILNGVLIEGVALLSASSTRVYHNLGRAYRGYIVVSNNKASTVHVDESSNSNPLKYIALKSPSTDSTVSLWVF